ncbi:MAG: glycosyltransferase [Clostridia bacterium]|nr:glycosyltransferase [Clostridia bacterium]
MINKRVLIISNNALSDGNSNGRTLKNFFCTDDKEKLAQFFIQPDTPDFDVCEKYFCATDGQVLKSFLKGRSAGSVIEKKEDKESGIQAKASKKKRRTPFTMLLRNFLWQRKKWRTGFYRWVEEYQPELVLLQAGDAPFMFDLAVEISKKYGAPLVIYNSEDYYFKDYNYFRNSGVWGMFYPTFRRTLRKATKKAIEHASLSIYISEDLKNTYDKEFSKPSEYVYTATDVVPSESCQKESVFSYLGNLGLNRHLGLIDIGNALNQINPAYKLDVYGKLPNEQVGKVFESAEGISYKGLISYEEVKEVIGKSMLVFHTESFEDFYVKDIRHGFSTKIADSLASGTPLVVYAPESISCSKYLKENDCALVVSKKESLLEELRRMINDKEAREAYVQKALSIVEKNHRRENNQRKVESLLNGIRGN